MSSGRRYLVSGVDHYRATSGAGEDGEYFIADFDDRDQAMAFAQAQAREPQAATPDACDYVMLRDVVEAVTLFTARRPAL